MHLLHKCLLLFLLILPLRWHCLQADEMSQEEGIRKKCPSVNAHQLYIGPEFYYIQRSRKGGTRQSGGLYAGKIGYDYIKRYRFYVGAEALYGQGTLEGHSGAGNKLKSFFTDMYAEGRVGYTLQQKEGYRFSLTPFIGGGYAEEKNNFIKPSPLTVHFRTYFTYAVGGFLSQMSWNRCFDIGVNFKVKYMIDARSKVSHDPEVENVKMLVKNEMHYRIELPLTYHYGECFWLSLVPFYEYRHYGNQPNYPFDFLETRLKLYGATLKLMYCL
jgi:hypothetical protein